MEKELYFSGEENRPQLTQGERYIPESKLKRTILNGVETLWLKTKLRFPKTTKAVIWTLKTSCTLIVKTCSITAKVLVKTAEVIKPTLPILGKVIVALATFVGWFALAFLEVSIDAKKKNSIELDNLYSRDENEIKHEDPYYNY